MHFRCTNPKFGVGLFQKQAMMKFSRVGLFTIFVVFIMTLSYIFVRIHEKTLAKFQTNAQCSQITKNTERILAVDVRPQNDIFLKLDHIEKRVNNLNQKIEELSCRKFDIGTRGGFCLTTKKLNVGYNWFWDVQLAYHLEDIFDNQVVGDFGAGLGWYGRYFLRKTQRYLRTAPAIDDDNFYKKPFVQELITYPQRLANWTGYDGAISVNDLTSGLVNYLDLSEPLSLNKRFDWIVSIEVGEHIPIEFEKTFLDNLQQHACKGIILTWAVPGQAGHHHVNNRPRKYLFNEMEKRGFLPEEHLASNLRQAASLGWLKNTLMVFYRKKPLNHPSCPRSPKARPRSKDQIKTF